MPVITLPDGSQRSFANPVTVHDVAADIGPGLAKAALAGVVDEREVDTSHIIERDATLAIITERDEAGLEIIRHSTAHLLAMAVQELFPGVQVTIGPVIEDGFYYDFATGHSFTPEDLTRIEQRMEELAEQDLPVERVVLSREKAIEQFRNMGENYKVQIIEDLPGGEEISLYRQGAWMDLCRGPHVPSTGKLGAFKLTKVAGAYWRGDAKNEMLQRIYGTAWANKKQLKQYLTPDRGSGKTRPSQDRQEAGPVPYPGGSAGHGVLAPGGLEYLPDHRAVHAQGPARAGLPGDQDAPAGGYVPVGALRARRQVWR